MPPEKQARIVSAAVTAAIRAAIESPPTERNRVVAVIRERLYQDLIAAGLLPADARKSANGLHVTLSESLN